MSGVQIPPPLPANGLLSFYFLVCRGEIAIIALGALCNACVAGPRLLFAVSSGADLPSMAIAVSICRPCTWVYAGTMAKVL